MTEKCIIMLTVFLGKWVQIQKGKRRLSSLLSFIFYAFDYLNVFNPLWKCFNLLY